MSIVTEGQSAPGAAAEPAGRDIAAWRERLLDERTATLAARRRRLPDSQAERRELMICRVGSHDLALPFEMIAGVRGASDVVPIPTRLDAVLGITVIKGTIYNVVDLARLLGSAPSARTQHEQGFFLLIQSVSPAIAVRVEDVLDVMTAEVSAISAADPETEGRRGIEGYVATGEGSQAAVIDLGRLIGALIQQNLKIGAGAP